MQGCSCWEGGSWCSGVREAAAEPALVLCGRREPDGPPAACPRRASRAQRSQGRQRPGVSPVWKHPFNGECSFKALWERVRTVPSLGVRLWAFHGVF